MSDSLDFGHWTRFIFWRSLLVIAFPKMNSGVGAKLLMTRLAPLQGEVRHRVAAFRWKEHHRCMGNYRHPQKDVWVPPTYNELPVPEGSWEKHYQRMNEKHNKHLVWGSGFFLFSLFMVNKFVDFNSRRPEFTDDDDDLCPRPEPEPPKKCGA